MATVASHKRLYTYYQRDGVDNHTYHREFLSFVETIETYGGLGAVGVIPVFLQEKIVDLHRQGLIADATAPTDDECALAVGAVREEYLAALMISGANREKFSALRTDLQNQYGYGNDLYPKTTDQCLSLLNRWTVTTPSRSKRGDNQINAPIQPKQEEENEALVFAQDVRSPPSVSPSHGTNSQGSSRGRGDSRRSPASSASISSGHRITTVKCKSCGRIGHTSSVCPATKRPPDQIHAMDADDASDASDTSSIIILTQYGVDSPTPLIDKNLVLLDSQSTVNLFSNPSCVTNIRPATAPIRVHCNKGTMVTDKQADFGGNKVYFDENGIANVLSLFRLSKKYHITYDSQDRNGVFRVFTDKGVVEFLPTEKGLHVLNLNDNPQAAYLLVNHGVPISNDDDHQLHVSTVWDNYEGFSKHQIKNAVRARRLMSMVATPSPRDFQGLVRHNLLKDCPITPDDVSNAHAIFGPDLASIRGKTVRCKPARVVTDYVDIPRYIFDIHKQVTLTADIMFVNSVPFLVSASRNINLITIEHAPTRTASKLASLLQRIIRVYGRAGFSIQTILMDNGPTTHLFPSTLHQLVLFLTSLPSFRE